jgi:hypothetical protein
MDARWVLSFCFVIVPSSALSCSALLDVYGEVGGVNSLLYLS